MKIVIRGSVEEIAAFMGRHDNGDNSEDVLRQIIREETRCSTARAQERWNKKSGTDNETAPG